jgi:monoamine oxidase
MLYSHSGIIAEMYDHTNFEEDKFGFTGFLNGAAASYSQDLRKELVLKQLNQLLGEQAISPLGYFDKVWTDDFVSAGSQIIQRPHQNNGHPLLHRAYLGNKLFFGGTETAAQSPGYMEGAVISAQELVKKVAF